MGIRAIRFGDDGSNNCPTREEHWMNWVAAADTRNFLLHDPLIDWLELYGKSQGYVSDDQVRGYEPRADFSKFVHKKGAEFETAIVNYLATQQSIIQVANDPSDSRNVLKAEETFRAMCSGAPLIYQGVLWDANGRTYGIPDLLVRSDVLIRLFPNCMSQSDSEISAPDLAENKWHYRVVDIKYTTLYLLVDGELGSSGSAAAYKAQLFLNNRALGRIQNYLPPVSYLLGRAWEQTIKKVTYRSDSCMDRLGPVDQNSSSLLSAVDNAVSWVQRIRRDGKNWVVLPKPTVAELYPNMGNTSDSPWANQKKHFAHELDELTFLWQVGADKRRSAHAAGILGWRHVACTPAAVGISGAKQAPVLQAMLDINRATTGPVVLPAKVSAAEGVWRSQPQLEFFVDFETVSDLDDDFLAIPRKAGQPMIFMIGCGHVENGKWQFACFIAKELVGHCEAEIIDQWLAHMNAVHNRLDRDGNPPRVMHWSHAELSTLVTAYNAAIQRHPHKAGAWIGPLWFDLLKEVVKAEPIVVRGAHAFGLKAVAQAMNAHGLISTKWESGPTDGLGAMVAAWNCANECSNHDLSLADHPLMRQISKYNEVDCKVMLEILYYLRAHH